MSEAFAASVRALQLPDDTATAAPADLSKQIRHSDGSTYACVGRCPSRTLSARQRPAVTSVSGGAMGFDEMSAYDRTAGMPA
jgi:hypothetical protein